MFPDISVAELIRQRYSCRAYQRRAVEPGQARHLQDYAHTITGGPFGTPLRFELFVSSLEDQDALKGLGTYGAIKDPAGFIIGAAPHGEMMLVDYGYALEQVILYATGLDLSTCWLGGNFTRTSFAKKIDASRQEIIPAVASVGYATPEIRSRDPQRLKVRSDTRLPWEELFFKNGFAEGLAQPEAGPYAIPLDMLRLAPSAHNYQPWRVVQDGPCYHFYLKRTPGYGPGNPAFLLLGVVDLQRMEIGIAMSHFELAARQQGLQGGWDAREDHAPSPPAKMEYIATWTSR